MFQSLMARPSGASSRSAPNPPVESVAPLAAGGTTLAAADRFGHHFGGYPLARTDRAPIQCNNEKKRKFAAFRAPSNKYLGRSRRPKYRNKDVNLKRRKQLNQVVHRLIPQKVETGTLPSGKTLKTMLDDVVEPKKKAPVEHETEKLRPFTKIPIKNLNLDLSGGNQGGLFPKDEDQRIDLPESVDYTHSRSGQILAQLGEVFLHRGDQAGKNPVEVQFGYGQKKDKSLDLFASSNNKKSQKWLLKALKNPVEHLKAAAQSDDEDIQRVALKILFLKEQNEERRKRIKGHQREKEIHEDLDRAEKIRGLVLSGNVGVVTNTASRHAEQNVADVLHEGDYELSDIQGPKIRCEGCSSELGKNLVNKKGENVIGRIYASQSEQSRHEETFKEIREGRTKVATNQSRRSRSSSPFRYKPQVPKKKVVVPKKGSGTKGKTVNPSPTKKRRTKK